MTEALFTSRRDFLVLGTALAGTALASGSTTVPLHAFVAAGTRQLAARPALVLYQAHAAHAVAFADELAVSGFATLALTDDPVRQWRDGLGRLVLEENFVLLGLGNWTDYSVLRGLAAEHRRFPLLERQLHKTPGTAWARQEARELLVLAQASDPQAALQTLNATRQVGGKVPSVFSWVI